MKKIILTLFFLIGCVNVYAENSITFRGKVVDYHSNVGIEGASIVFYSTLHRRLGIVSSNANGQFEFTTSESYNHILITHPDYLDMAVKNINVDSKNTIDFCFSIPLVENPFVSFRGRELSRAERREYREWQRIVAQRLGSNETIRYSRRGQYQYIEFSNLTNCER